MKQAADQEKRLAAEVTEIESEVRNVMNNLQIRIRMRRTGFWAKMAAVPAIVEKKVCQISAIRLMR